jgi:hypothetical protein
MEMLEDKIRAFSAISNGSDAGAGAGYGSAIGRGFGGGYGICNNDHNGTDGVCAGVDVGGGYGCGFGSPDGNGYGWGDNLGVKDINGNIVCIIDDIPTIITSVRNNIAKGFIVKSDLQFEPCYIVKENNQFAHGDTLKDAFMSLQEKLYDDSTEEERIEAFMKQFPEYDVKYDNMDLFVYHHVLTGSCRMGREAFMSNKGLSLDGKTSVREFVKLTQDAYGGDIIKKLPEAYGIE